MTHIAIISENLIFSKLLDSYLKRKVPECMVTWFSSFSLIKEKIHRADFDMIMVDGFMSGVESFEIIDLLRRKKRIDCPICFFSDAYNDFLKIKANKNGINYHFRKPFDAHAVTSEIASYLVQSKN
jgi:DNA-binding response OmpR family regulator